MGTIRQLRPQGADGAYIAALIDEDGNLYERGQRVEIRVMVRDHGIAAWLRTFGGHVRRSPGRGAWEWHVGAQADVTRVLALVAPHLRSRGLAAIAERALTRAGTPGTGTGTVVPLRPGQGEQLSLFVEKGGQDGWQPRP